MTFGMTSQSSWQHSISKSEKRDGLVVSIFSPYLHITARHMTFACERMKTTRADS